MNKKKEIESWGSSDSGILAFFILLEIGSLIATILFSLAFILFDLIFGLIIVVGFVTMIDIYRNNKIRKNKEKKK